MIGTYVEFTEKLIDRFDSKDPELHLKDLTQLKQTGTVEQYISEFEKLAILVTEISERHKIVIFIDGLSDSLKGWVKSLNPLTLQTAVKRGRELEPSSEGNFFNKGPPPKPEKDKQPFNKDNFPKNRLDKGEREELRRKKLCFSCREAWQPGHRCLGKGKIHYIEVMSDSEDEENVDPNIERASQNTESETGTKQGEGVIASMTGTPHYNIFRVRGVLNGQRVIVMLDSGSTHNFIDAALVERHGLQTEKHEGFDVRVAGGTNLSSTHKVPKLNITLGNYTVTDDFYVIDLGDTNVVLGI